MLSITRMTTAAAGLLLSAALAGTLGATAPPARADEAGFLGRIAAAGVDLPGTDAMRISTGRYVCRLIQMYGHTGTYRSNISPGDLIRQLTDVYYITPQAADAVVQAARAEICPETL